MFSPEMISPQVQRLNGEGKTVQPLSEIRMMGNIPNLEDPLELSSLLVDEASIQGKGRMLYIKWARLRKL